MDGAPLPSVDRSQAEDRSTAIDAMMSGLEFQGFGFGVGSGAGAVHRKVWPIR